MVMLVCSALAHAQQLTIKDNVTHQPLEFATIYSSGLNVSAITNIKGQADIPAFKNAGDILIQLMGYLPKQTSYDLLKNMNFVIFLEPSQINLDEVVVSANRWGQQKSQVPNKITIIPASQISMQNPQTSADLLGISGGVFIQKSQLGGGSPMIRGFATNRVLITVDGVRMNNAIFRSGNLQNVISIDPFSIERTEVIFGPGSVIYGSDAIGGVMNFSTLNPTLAFSEKMFVKGSANARFSSANAEKTGHFDFNIGLKKWAFVTSATFSDFGDLKMGSNGPDEYLRPEYVERINGVDSIIPNADPEKQVPTGYSQLNLMQKIKFKPNENWTFNYGIQYSATSDYSRYDRLILYSPEKPKSAEWYYGPQVWMINNLNFVNSAKTKVYDKMSISLAHQYFKESRHDRGFGKSTLKNRTEEVNVISANIDFDKELGKKQRLFYGAEILLNKVGSTGNDENIKTEVVSPAASRYPDGSTWNSYAAYLSYWKDINSQLTFQAGLRYNYITLDATFDTTAATGYPFPFTTASINSGALTGSAGLTYRPAKDWVFYTNFSTGFRAPNIDDVGKVFDSEPGFVIVPNPDLKSEYAYNGEVGVKKRFADMIEIDLSAFYILLDNAMVRRDYTLHGQDSIEYDDEMSKVQAIQNAAQAYVYGIQADLEANLPVGFGITSHFNYQKGEEELDDNSTAPLRHAAPWYGSTHFTYTRNRLKADLYGVYNGEVSYENLAPSEQDKAYIYAIDSDGNPYSPSWYTLNFKVLYQLTDYLALNAGIENLTDQRYRPYSSGITAAGMNFIASVKATF
jgi:hemoglobin/transferrin/lactoferrin receptor protein